MEYTYTQLEILKTILNNNKQMNEVAKNFQPKYTQAFDSKFFGILTFVKDFYRRKEAINESNIGLILQTFRNENIKKRVNFEYGEIEVNKLVNDLQELKEFRYNIKELLICNYDEYIKTEEDKLIVQLLPADKEERATIFHLLNLLKKEDGESDTESYSAKDIQDILLAKLERRLRGVKDENYEFPMFQTLSKYIAGSLKKGEGNLISVIAPTGKGKTAFTINLALNNTFYRKELGGKQYKTVLIETEMNKISFSSRMISMLSGISEEDFNDDIKFEKIKDKWTYYASQFGLLELQTDFLLSGLDTDLYRLIEHYAIIDGAEFIFVDYLQDIKMKGGSSKNIPTYQQIEMITTNLANLARKLGIKIIVTSQVNREGESKTIYDMHKGMIAGSYDSNRPLDVLMILGETPLEEYKTAPYLGNRRIKVNKNRNDQYNDVIIRGNQNIYNMRWTEVKDAVDNEHSKLDLQLEYLNPYNEDIDAATGLYAIFGQSETYHALQKQMEEKENNKRGFTKTPESKQELLFKKEPVQPINNPFLNSIQEPEYVHTDLSEAEFEWI